MLAARYSRIISVSLPIIGGMLSQNVLNMVDSAMLGRLPADVRVAGLAAVGLAGFANFLAASLILGLSAGVQAIAARRVGEGRLADTAEPLHAGIVVSICFGAPVAVALYALTPSIFPFLHPDPLVSELGSPYLQARLIAMPIMGVNFSFRGFWNGVQKSWVYMATLLTMHASNIFLNYCLIYGNLGAPALGVAGAGIATAVSVYLGTGLYIFLGWKEAQQYGFLHARPSLQTFRSLLRLALPGSMQQLFFSGGLLALFWIIGRVGTAESAAAKIMTDLLLLAYLPGMGLGMAGASLVGEALGKKDHDDAARWGWDVARTGGALLGLIGLPLVLAPDWCVSLFLNDPAVVELARWPLRMAGVCMFIEGVGFALMNSLLGAGDSRRVMMISIGLQWGLFLPLAYALGPSMKLGLLAIWAANVFYRMLLAGAFYLSWRGGRWKHIRL
ncbi:MAG: MATE family efflux transporter [Leptospirales bacterium]|nr:MATE family efflux transporter [Leptospirales bacterium]